MTPIIRIEREEPVSLVVQVRRGEPPLEVWTPSAIITVQPGKALLLERDAKGRSPVFDTWTGSEARDCIRPRPAADAARAY